MRAGLIEAPVVGATGMIAANTTRPIATPAKPAAALRWMTPKIVKTRMNVPTNSAVKACAMLTVSASYAATPSPTSLAGHAEHADDGRGADDRADDLRADVGRDLAPRELAGGGEPEGDRRVDVVAADVPERVDGGDDDGAERQGDHPEVGHGERRVAVHDQGGGDRADADEHQEGRPEGLSAEALEQIGLVKHLP